MATKGKLPPILRDDMDYSNWVNDVKVWSMFTDLDKKKIGPAVYLSLEGKARECCKNIVIEKLRGSTEIGELLSKLKDLFAKDSEQEAFMPMSNLKLMKDPKEWT